MFTLLLGRPEGRRPLGKSGIDGRIILKWNLKEVGFGGHGLE
jgi:hypothetical protein